MDKLLDMTDRLAESVMAADANDLPGLAHMHSQLQDLVQAAQEAVGATEAAAHISSIARNAGQLIERVILREATDAAENLAQVAREVADLQQLVRQAGGVCKPGQAPFVPVAASSAAASQSPDNSNATPAAEDSASQTAPINPDDVPLIVEFLTEARGHIDSAEAAVLQVEEHPEDMEAINAIFRGFHTIKGVAGFLNLKQIGSLAHGAENLLDKARKSELQLIGRAVDLVLQSIDAMKVMIDGLEEALKTGAAPAIHQGLAGILQQLRDFAARQIASAAAVEKPAETTAEATAEKLVENAASAPVTPPAAGTPVQTGTAPASPSATADTTVKVNTDRLDNLINMVGELVIAESMVRQDMQGALGGNQRLARNVSHLGKIARSLQELSMSMRMVQIHGVFQKMARLVRDLSRKALKEIEFITAGAETELDRNVVEAISDPLVHMVRNSVDHGVETPDVRERAGKPRMGHVTLRAYHKGGSIIIQIEDDGRGLNKARILRKAIDAGIVRADQQLSEQEIFSLIFHAGLSTAEKITDVSGRGVGMDVVRKNIEALRGHIEITSTEGKGTVFTIRLPLTLAVIDGLVVMVGEQRYILPMTSIEQSLRPTAKQVSTIEGKAEMCMVRGNLLPLYRLHRLFNIVPRTEDPTKALAVVVQDMRRRCCLLVDDVLGQQQVVIKSLGDGVGQIKGVSGGAILGDGNVSMILDVPGLMDLGASN